jgi:hypothetical protein
MSTRCLGMLRDEPELLYIYECIKVGGNSSSCQKGEVIFRESKELDEEYYKLIGTYRRAFVGDMQKKLDEAMECSNMERYAKSDSGLIPEHIYHTEVVYVKITLFEQFRNWVKNKIVDYIKKKHKEKEDSLYLERKLFGEQEYPFAESYKQTILYKIVTKLFKF